MDETREFDLNIERVLEHWTLAHAVRELIANCPRRGRHSPRQRNRRSPRMPTRRGISVTSDGGVRYEHLTQNENKEKLANPGKVVGKFGVGLKDALRDIRSSRDPGANHGPGSGRSQTVKQHKHGFDDITTLHAVIRPSGDPDMVGTDVSLSGHPRRPRSMRPSRSSATTRATRYSRRLPTGLCWPGPRRAPAGSM